MLTGALLSQGVICFESIMAAAEALGQVTDGKPIICKPSNAVCPSWLTTCR